MTSLHFTDEKVEVLGGEPPPLSLRLTLDPLSLTPIQQSGRLPSPGHAPTWAHALPFPISLPPCPPQLPAASSNSRAPQGTTIRVRAQLPGTLARPPARWAPLRLWPVSSHLKAFARCSLGLESFSRGYQLAPQMARS